MSSKAQPPSLTDLYLLNELIELDNSKAWEDLCARDIAIGKECQNSADIEKLTYWIQKLSGTVESPPSKLNEAYTTNTVGIVALFFGFFGMATFLFGSKDVNVLMFLYIFVLPQFLFCILSAFMIYRSRQGAAPPMPVPNPIKILLPWVFTEGSFLRQCPSLARLLALKYSQEAGVVFTIGAIIGMLFTFETIDPGFTWGAVFGDIESMRRMVDTVSLPWSNLPTSYYVSDETIQVSHRYISSPETPVEIHKETQKWAPFLIISMVVYALWLRLVLWATSRFVYRRNLRDALVVYPGSGLILVRMNPQKEMNTPVFCVLAPPYSKSDPIIDVIAPLPSIYKTITTKGIPHAAEILNGSKGLEIRVSDRPAALAQYMNDHKHDLRFREDFRTLEPILHGAGAIYFVDGNVPYKTDYEREMEILGWTGRVGLAVIDSSTANSVVKDWKRILPLYFPRVLILENQSTDSRRQLEMLEALEDIYPGWKGPLSQAIHLLRKTRYLSHENSGAAITSLILSAVQYHVIVEIPKSQSKRKCRRIYEAEYREHMELKEFETWRQMIRNYVGLGKDASQKHDFKRSDLFDMTKGRFYAGGFWRKMAWKLSSLGAGTLLKLEGVNKPEGGKAYYFKYQPAVDVNLPFVLLGRSIFLQKSVTGRPSVVPKSISGDRPLLDFLSKKDQHSLARNFSEIRHEKKVNENVEAIAAFVVSLCKLVDEKN